VDKLLSIGFALSLIDDCVFFRDDIIFMVYVDNGIFLGINDSKLQDALGLNIEDQGHPADYVGVNIKKLRDGSYEFTQRALIDLGRKWQIPWFSPSYFLRTSPFFSIPNATFTM
jgi:hypothetical protein